MGSRRLEARMRDWGWAGFTVILVSYTAALLLVSLLWQRQARAVSDELERYTRTEALVLGRLLLFDLASDPRVAEAHRIEVILEGLGDTGQPHPLSPALVDFVRGHLEWPDTELWKRAEAAGLNSDVGDVTAARRQVYTEMLEDLLQGIREDLTARVTFSDNLRGVLLRSSRGAVIQVGEAPPEALTRGGEAERAIRVLPDDRLLVALPLTIQANRWGMAYLLMDRGVLARLTQALLATLRGGLWAFALLLVLFAAAWGMWWSLLLARVRRQVVIPIVDLAKRMEGSEQDPPVAPPETGEPEWLAEAFDRLMSRLAEQRDQLLRAQRLGLMERVGAGLSHEINNALNPARLRLDELSMGGRAPDMEDVRVLREYLAHAQRVLKDLTFAVKSPSGPLRPIPPEEWLDVAKRLVEPHFQGGPALLWRVPSGHPMACGDPQWLVQISVNLILNARDAVAPLGAEGRVEVTLEGEGGEAVLRVTDNGPGIGPEVAKHLFEPFVTSKTKGSGLGLFVVDHLTRRMGGRVSIGGTPGGGTVAEVRLLGTDGEEHGHEPS